MINIKINLKRIILIVLILAWMYVIYGFSNQTGEVSGGLSLKIAKILCRNEENIEIVHMFVRKLAHFTLYTIGGFLIYSLFDTFNIKKKKIVMLITIIIGFLYASSDEIHQSFISGRSGQFTDVLLDSSGVFFGGILSYLYSKLSKKAKQNVIIIGILFLVLAWMNVVFMFSNQDGASSQSLSLKITKMITSDEKKIRMIHPLIRKLAHYILYTIGGALIYFLVNRCNIKQTSKIILTLFLGILYASTDELHQYFIERRTARITDIWIDFLGVITGIFIAKFICKAIIIKSKDIKSNVKEERVEKNG